MRAAIAALAALSLCGCKVEEPISKGKSDKGNWNVSLLFEHDGCRAYNAVADGYRDFYFVKCGDLTRADWSVTRLVGKAVVTDFYNVETQTK